MDYYVYHKENAYPCLVTIDSDNDRFLIQTEDTSGRIFDNSPALLAWVKRNWSPADLVTPEDYQKLLHSIAIEMNQQS